MIILRYYNIALNSSLDISPISSAHPKMISRAAPSQRGTSPLRWPWQRTQFRRKADKKTRLKFYHFDACSNRACSRRSYLSKTKQKQLQVMDGWLVANVPVPCSLQQVSVVLGQAGSKGSFGYLGSPKWQQAVATGVSVLEHGRLPLVPDTLKSDSWHVAVHVYLKNLKTKPNKQTDWAVMCLHTWRSPAN